MKTNFLLFLVLAFYSCHKSDSEPNPEPVNKYFNSVDLLNLKLDSVPGFWEKMDSLTFIDSYFPYSTDGEVKRAGIAVYNKTYRQIGVAVFDSQAMAISRMEERIDNVAVRIREGLPSATFPGKWWYSNSAAIFVNQNNTIVEITILDSQYKDAEQLLAATALEIIQRVDKLSEPLK